MSEEAPKTLYGIDMGSPTEKGGFFAWRWREGAPLESFRKWEGWNDCIYRIAKDANESEVHVAIEAPLWGARDEEGWTYRIELDRHREYQWYVGAGGAVGLMAQQFLAELTNALELPPPRLIKIYESYVSGFQASPEYEDEPLQKPEPPFRFSKIRGNPCINDHSKDAFWSLLMLGRELNVLSFKEAQVALSNVGISCTPFDLAQKLGKARIRELIIEGKLSHFPLGILSQKGSPFELKVKMILLADQNIAGG